MDAVLWRFFKKCQMYVNQMMVVLRVAGDVRLIELNARLAGDFPRVRAPNQFSLLALSIARPWEFLRSIFIYSTLFRSFFLYQHQRTEIQFVQKQGTEIIELNFFL